MSYTQLTREQRYQIYALQKAGHIRTEIARHVGVHQATLSRELVRNLGGRGYRPKQADEWARERQKLRVRPRIQPETWRQVAPCSPGSGVPPRFRVASRWSSN